jgi:hypothetical protein
MGESDAFGGGARQVDQAVANMRTAIGDLHDHGTSIAEIGDFNLAAKR